MDRLHKRIAAAGVASRRAAEKLIQEGRVLVNGQVVTELGTKVAPEDKITVDGKELESARLHYVVLNKPRGIVTTLADPHAKRTVKDFIPDLGVTLKPVGRLDKDTEGLILLTNDGALAMRLTHPRFGVEKEYQVAVEGELLPKEAEKLAKGIYIEGGKTAPAQVDGVFYDENKKWTFFRIVIHEGRKRQIREMCMAVGHPVKKLRRVRIGPVHINRLPRGQSRVLGKQEIDALFEVAGLKRAEDRGPRAAIGRNPRKEASAHPSVSSDSPRVPSSPSKRTSAPRGRPNSSPPRKPKTRRSKSP